MKKYLVFLLLVTACASNSEVKEEPKDIKASTCLDNPELSEELEAQIRETLAKSLE